MEVGWSGWFVWLVPFAKETIGVGWGIRECTPLGVQGLVGKYGAVECRRPLGLRAKGLRDADEAKAFYTDGQFVTDGRAPGIEAEMDGGLWDSYPPLVP
jgi:hypothetical protein